MKLAPVFLFALAHSFALLVAAESWTVRVEEPTGLFPRTNEVVSVPYTTIGGKKESWTVVDTEGRELPFQTTENSLLFPATLIPGELPQYQISAVQESKANFI